VVRELWGAYHEMLRIVKFVIDIKPFGMKIEPKIENEMNWNSKFTMTLFWQETQKQGIEIQDVLCICLMHRFIFILRLREVLLSPALKLSVLLYLKL
jgi:hypothetical protein